MVQEIIPQFLRTLHILQVKVKTTTHAVKNQFPDSELIACIELHTYSLDPVFIKEYKDTLHYADEAIVFYSSKALEIKKKNPIPTQDIKDAVKTLKCFLIQKIKGALLISKSLRNTNLLFYEFWKLWRLILEDFIKNYHKLSTLSVLMILN